MSRGNDGVAELHDALSTSALARHRSCMHTFFTSRSVTCPRDIPAALEATEHRRNPSGRMTSRR
jgi:hypothetical protein